MNANVWKNEKLFLNIADYFKAVEKEIAAAQTSIDLEVYIFQNDRIGQSVAAALAAAARRGVAVRLLVDAVGSAPAVEWLRKTVENAGGHFKTYNAFSFWNFGRFFRYSNHRNHRKVCVIDRDRAFVGSMNVVVQDWKEIGLYFEGEKVTTLSAAFEKAWFRHQLFRHRHRLRPFARYEPGPLRLNDSLRRRTLNYLDFLARIQRSQERIWLGNAYFAPDFRLIKQLCRAAQRKVDVRLLVPRRSDIFFMPWVTSTYYYGLLRAGVKIFEYQPRFYHAKVRILDDWMLIGSSNLNHRSLLHDLEVDAQVAFKENQQTLEEDLGRDLASSKEVHLEDLKRISWLKRIVARVFLLFKYWL